MANAILGYLKQSIASRSQVIDPLYLEYYINFLIKPLQKLEYLKSEVDEIIIDLEIKT